jgi:hypothetical protein
MMEVERCTTKYKRVKNSGRMTGAPPLTEPYPFMVDHDWWNEKKNFPEYSEFLGTWLTRWADPCQDWFIKGRKRALANEDVRTQQTPKTLCE